MVASTPYESRVPSIFQGVMEAPNACVGGGGRHVISRMVRGHLVYHLLPLGVGGTRLGQSLPGRGEHMDAVDWHMIPIHLVLFLTFALIVALDAWRK